MLRFVPSVGLTNTLLLLSVSVMLAAGQFLFKRTGLAIQNRPLAESVRVLATFPSFFLALALYGCATVLWIYALSRVPLTAAYPWIAATSVAVPLIGYLFYGEQVTLLFWAGLALMIAGFVLTQLGLQH